MHPIERVLEEAKEPLDLSGITKEVKRLFGHSDRWTKKELKLLEKNGKVLRNIWQYEDRRNTTSRYKLPQWETKLSMKLEEIDGKDYIVESTKTCGRTVSMATPSTYQAGEILIDKRLESKIKFVKLD